MAKCEFSEPRSGGAYGHCKLILTDVSSSWYMSLCIKEPNKCPYVKVCPICKVKNSTSSAFCQGCGNSLKK